MHRILPPDLRHFIETSLSFIHNDTYPNKHNANVTRYDMHTLIENEIRYAHNTLNNVHIILIKRRAIAKGCKEHIECIPNQQQTPQRFHNNRTNLMMKMFKTIFKLLSSSSHAQSVKRNFNKFDCFRVDTYIFIYWSHHHYRYYCFGDFKFLAIQCRSD